MTKVAIVGLSCRFPRAPNPRAFWRLLRDEVDAIREVPADRWDIDAWYSPKAGEPGKMNTRWGGFIDDLDQFDAEFFKITPREAALMDPQQRLVLEVACEALDDAGLVAARLAGSRTGVFLGVNHSDYGALIRAREIVPEAFYATGTSLCIVSNRLSYLFDLRGPSMSIDTACSASLVALHLARQSLASGEIDQAIVGGVSAQLSPVLTAAFSSGGATAPDGRCKAFDARANGYVRGEGAGMVVLKPLEAAVRDGDRIRAVLLGTAVNQDGLTNGLTAPSGLAQEAVIREACRAANVRPGDLEYVEAHGTGTFLGDPIEAHALGAVLAEGGPRARPCAIGSVKSNIGHLEAAAGIAGLIKLTLALEQRTLPASLHFETPNPHIPFEKLGLAVQTRTAAWDSDRPLRLAGVSSFGFGGTNAHAILGEAEPVASQPTGSGRAMVVPISAQSARALEALAWSYLDELGPSGTLAGTSIDAIAHTAAHRRGHHRFRLAVIARSREELTRRLTELLEGATPLDGKPLARITLARSVPAPPPIAFVFSGFGTQWTGMGRELFAEQPVFRQTLEQIDVALRPHLKRSMVALLTSADTADLEHASVAIVQPAIFAMQLALVALWRSLGIVPAAMLGHSTGELAAACAAGAISLDDAARLICVRARMLVGLEGRGRVLAAVLDAADADKRCAELTARFPSDLAVAAYNAPNAVAFSGSPHAIEALMEHLVADGITCTLVEGFEAAPHGPHMDPLLRPLADAVAGVAPATATVPLYSTVLGARVNGNELDAGYWVRNLREPVQLWPTLRAAIDGGIGTFLEISPHPALRKPFRQAFQAMGRPVRSFHSIRRQGGASGEHEELLHSLAALHVHGYPIAWSALGSPTPPAELPRYPWQHLRHWVGEPTVEPRPRAGLIAERLAAHPAVAAALCHDIVNGSDTRRIALVVAHPGAAVDAVGLRRWLLDHFEGRELPVSFTFVAELPSDPDAILPPDPFGELIGVHLAPRNATEATLAGLWSETLGVEKVGIRTSFFALGGTSLLAIRISSRIRELFDVEIAPGALFPDPTIAGMAELVEQTQREREQRLAELDSSLGELSDEELLRLVEQTEAAQRSAQ